MGQNEPKLGFFEFINKNKSLIFTEFFLLWKFILFALHSVHGVSTPPLFRQPPSHKSESCPSPPPPSYFRQFPLIYCFFSEPA